MKIVNAFVDGMRRVTSARAVLFGLLLLTFLVALPLGLALGDMIRDGLGESLGATRAASGVNYEWWEEYSARAEGVGRAFSPRTIGFGGVLDNVSSLLDDRGHPAVVAGAGAAYLLLWVFLVGGIIDRYARNRRVRTAAFFSACGVFFFRFLRLGVLALAGYALLFGYLHSWLFDGLYGWVTSDWVVERNAFLFRLALYALFGGALAAYNLLFDYAKVRAVVEDRRSMIGALMAAFRFIARRPVDTIGLYLLDAGVFVVVLALYGAIAPGAGGAGWSMWLGLLAAEAYLLLRLGVKLLFYASEVSLFQSSLAHAHYAAAPIAAWPDSPAAEAIAGGAKAESPGPGA